MQIEIKGENLIITVPFSKVGTPSKSGKSIVHATTNGNQPTSTEVGGKPLVVSVNAYVSAK